MVTRDPLPRIQTFGMTPALAWGGLPRVRVRSQRARVRNAGRDGNGVVESDDGGRGPGLEGPVADSTADIATPAADANALHDGTGVKAAARGR
jgi:hypothetical protein